MKVVRLTAGLEHWERPLQAWFDVLDRYKSASGATDVAFWYNERATLSTIAGALWLSGHLVLEEYSTRRGGEGIDAGNGRTDLWCRIDDHAYTVEAKQHWDHAYPAKPGTLPQWAEIQLADAAKQCASDNNGGARRIAMAFVVPKLLADPSDSALEEWGAIIDGFAADLKAYQLVAPAVRSPANGRFFPGVALLGRLTAPLDDVTPGPR